MGWFSGTVVFIMIWWVIFFTTLPFGNRSSYEEGEAAQPGHAPSAPIKPRLWLKVGITTLISCALWGVAYYLIASETLSFRAAPVG